MSSKLNSSNRSSCSYSNWSLIIIATPPPFEFRSFLIILKLVIARLSLLSILVSLILIKWYCFAWGILLVLLWFEIVCWWSLRSSAYTWVVGLVASYCCWLFLVMSFYCWHWCVELESFVNLTGLWEQLFVCSEVLDCWLIFLVCFWWSLERYMLCLFAW